MKRNKQPALRIHCRWMIRRDMEEVFAIEASSWRVPWTENDFAVCLRERNCIGMVAESGDVVIGFMVYELLPAHLRILNMAVAPDFRRRSIGRQMVEKLKGKLHGHRRDALIFTVEESNLGAQLFLRACGFKAVKIMRRHFDREDGYLMQYALPVAQMVRAE